jgi:hypothetical protein
MDGLARRRRAQLQPPSNQTQMSISLISKFIGSSSTNKQQNETL